jgi:C-terminal processing protease CtpA/Prc
VCAACGGWNGSVGAILGKDNRTGRVFVREAPSGLGAARAGVQEGDEVTAIDGKPTSAMTPDELRGALRGKVGTFVTVTIARRGETLTLSIERSPFQEPP